MDTCSRASDPEGGGPSLRAWGWGRGGVGGELGAAGVLHVMGNAFGKVVGSVLGSALGTTGLRPTEGAEPGAAADGFDSEPLLPLKSAGSGQLRTEGAVLSSSGGDSTPRLSAEAVSAPHSLRIQSKHQGQAPAFLCQVYAELWKLLEIAGPMAALNCVVYVRAMVSVLSLGCLGGLQLAGGALAVGFTNITGYSILAGLASGMDPVCGQAFGSGNFGMVGLALQRTILILLSVSVPISGLWYNLEAILLALRQDAAITAVAAEYCLWSLPDLLANSFLQPLRIYLKSQGLATPMFWCSALAVVLHIPLSIVFVFVLEMGVPGVALAAVCTNLNMVIFILGYLGYSGASRGTWVPWSWACLHDWYPLLSLALPSCLGVCLEWWWYEIMTVVAGYLPTPQVAVATTAIVIQTTSLMYTFPQALSSSVSTRVGNELGANNPCGARLSALVALGCAFMIALVNVVCTMLLRNTWGRVFTDDQDVLALTAAVLPLLGLCELGNCPQTTGVGVLRGSARPAVGARINLGSFYFVGTPVAVALAFWFKVGFGGLWYGLLAAQIACAVSILFVVLGTDWTEEARRANDLTHPEPSTWSHNFPEINLKESNWVYELRRWRDRTWDTALSAWGQFQCPKGPKRTANDDEDDDDDDDAHFKDAEKGTY